MVVLKRILLVYLLSIAAPVAYAEWYSASGQAVVFDNHLALARQQAAAMALRKIYNEAGISLAAMELLGSDELGSELFVLKQSVPLQQLIIQQEYQKDDLLTITLSAEVWPGASICRNERNIAKAILLAPLRIVEPAVQTVYEGLDLTAEINRRFIDTLGQARTDFLIKTVLPAPLDISYEAKQAAALAALALEHESQYILSGRITNLAFGRKAGKLFSQDSWNRQFSMETTLTDGLTGQLIQRKTYRARTNWPYSPTAQFSASSDQLWRSAYGIEIERLLQVAADDAASALSCARLKAQVIHTKANRVLLSAGSRQGVVKGDRFRILNISTLPNQQFHRYQFTRHDGALLKVTQVYPDYAEAIPVAAGTFLVAQVRDIVQLENDSGDSNDEY